MLKNWEGYGITAYGDIVDTFVPMDADGKSVYDTIWTYLLD